MKTLEELMKEKEEIRKAYEALEDNAENAGKLDDLMKRATDINGQIAEYEKRKKLKEALNDPEQGKIIDRMKGDQKKMENRKEEALGSMEYRRAFMDFVRTGKMKEEFRDVAITSDNGAVLPATTLNQIVEKLENYGNILPRVHRIAYPAGLIVPTSVTSLAAEWQAENAAVNIQAKKTGQVTFTAYQLRASAGVSFQMDIRSLSAFESTLVKNITDAMGKALEQAIVAGTGTGQPTGITAATPAATVTLSASPTYKDLAKIVKAIPSAYKSGSVLVMNEGTAIELTTITDTAGQPVAHVNYGVDGQPVYRILGKEIVTTDYLPDIDAADAGAGVAFAVDLGKYFLNTAYDMDMRTYIDDSTRAKVYDSVMLCDGKLVDANGLVKICKHSA